MTEPAPAPRLRRVRRWLLGGLGLLVLAAFVPLPQPAVETGPLWSQMDTLRGAAPTSEGTQRGSPYRPVGLVLVGYAFDLDVGDPSGSTAYREFGFDDEPSARAAAEEAVRAGLRNGYSMQSGQYSAGEVWPQGDGLWGDDGWNADGDQHLVVWLQADVTNGWAVHVLLEHTY